MTSSAEDRVSNKLANKTAMKGGPKSTSKYKQSSLLAFFNAKPTQHKSSKESDAKSPPIITPQNSSPVRGEEAKEVKSGAVSDDKENKAPQNLAPTIPESPELFEPRTPSSVNRNSVPNASQSPLMKSRRAKKISYIEDSAEETDSDISVPRTKRRKMIADDDEDDDYKLESDNASADDDYFIPDTENIADELNGDDSPGEMDEEGNNHVSSKPAKTSPKSTDAGTSMSAFKFESNCSYIAADKSKISTKRQARKQTPQSKFAKENEERYQWLVHIKDADGRSESDPDYDPRTLYIPKSAWAKFTAFEKQYWEIKSKMWDSIVFFKKGKFFELYEKDADIGHQKFDLKLAGTGRANMRLAGIPEMSFDYWAKKFIDEGYKVAKVDQKESLLAKEIREKNANTKDDKVIKRELSCVLTCGTLTDEGMLSDEMSRYCLSLKEVTNNDNSKTFGVCFVDTATGKIQLTQFDDDVDCNKLETLLAQVQPMEVLIEKSRVSQLVLRMLKFNSQPHATFNFLKPADEFWTSDIAFEQLTRGKYFEANDLDDLSNYPNILVEYYESNKNVGFSAFGALLWYLKSLKLDTALISMGNIEQYDPYKTSFSDSCMRLDGVTLQNLEIFSNSFDQSDKGTLFKLLNRAVSPFGKRTFKSWVTHPLMSRKTIESRLDSVEILMRDGDFKHLLESKLGKLPDLERLLARIHSGNLKVKDFARCVTGFECIVSLVKILKSTYSEGTQRLGGELGKILDSFPHELPECVSNWSNAFDRVLAVNDGILVPEPGVEPEFDESNLKIKELEKELERILSQYRREFKCQEMCYKDSGKEIYLIEVPSKAISRIPKDWQQMAATSKCKRYWSAEVKKLVRKLMEARELHKIIGESLQARMYGRFMNDYPIWSSAIKAVAQLDCILSLARASESLGTPSCRPEFIDSASAQIEFQELRHPCFIPGGITGTKDFIPNDISLGVDQKDHIGLLTGANAAGKSTVLRMTCVATIMAQIGCFVPAKSAKMTPVDTIMTRLGANDNIMQGKSTFYVELSETKKILESCTPRSLIILDELGRGGSSSDGFAIAEAVLHHIATHVQSIGFFATHYATLGNSFINHPRVKPLRMGIIVDENSRNITFLYKLESGRSSGSFGMHVAAMCGVPRSIVDNAEQAAEKWEHTSKLKKRHVDADLVPLGFQSDVSWILNSKSVRDDTIATYTDQMKLTALSSMFHMIESL
ncbi:hypothetical protein KL925_001371 [Ogataea polymorpha]|nr:hypothetical protein KL936_001370 [Ogataea polymorpha]KAG7928071.1 hypothetical protein KL925_001371 [Ogataea polymorpha]